MIQIDIPGFKRLRLEHVVLDYNGTLAVDGKLIVGAGKRLAQLAKKLQIHVLTADTFGLVQSQIKGLPCKVSILPSKDIHRAKLQYVRKLGLEKTVCIGNGRNDRLMLKSAVIGICILQREGSAVESVSASKALCSSINDAIDLLLHPLRLVATLRS